MSDQGIFELVWENGQLLTRGFSKTSQKSPSFNNGHSFDHSSNARLENGRDTFPSKSHFNEYFSEHNRGNISYDHKLLQDSQVVPVHDTAAPTGNSNSQAHQFSLKQQQQHQVSALLKTPNLFSWDVLPNSKTLLEPEWKKNLVNFSLFLGSSAVPTRGYSRAEKLQNKQVLEAPAAYGSKSVTGLQNQLNSMELNAELLSPPGANNESVPDMQSEAVKGKLDAGKCKEPVPVPSSSFCSLRSSNNPTYNTFKRRYEDTEGYSACPSDHNEERQERNAVSARGSKSNKKKRTPEIHNLSERRRRDKINKKMRALQELIPNCNKVDKASILGEAIEYLKTLQFQVKMMSMGTGVCMPPMMLPQMSHFSPMGIGMGMGMQMGFGCNPAQFLIPPIARATAVPGAGIFPETRIPMPGFPGQPLPMSTLRAPLGLVHKTIPVVGVSPGDATSKELTDSAPLTNSKDSVQIVKVNKGNVDRSKVQRSA